MGLIRRFVPTQVDKDTAAVLLAEAHKHLLSGRVAEGRIAAGIAGQLLCFEACPRHGLDIPCYCFKRGEARTK